jgi:dihydroorotate dehydrogenase
MDLSITVNGMKFPNPFLLGSGPPGTNARVLAKSYEAGWGGAVAKTVSLESAKVVNVVPRYGKLRSRSTGEVIGFENIELISDRPIDVWLEEFRQVKKEYPNNILIASIMEEYEKSRWQELVRMVQDTGVDGFELNFSCPHGMTERKMGSEMGEHPDLTQEVTRWVTEVSKIPVWAKMTPNITNIREPAMAADPVGNWRRSRDAAADADRRRLLRAWWLLGAGRAADRVADGQPTRARSARRCFD